MPAGSLDRWLDDYERGRPGWPPEVVDIPDLSSAATVLDLGAGTGKLTRLLVSAFGRVFAVEPAEAMRRLLVTLCPGAEALAGAGEEIPLPDASVDSVFAAEAFHWFDGERALAEIARVLRPEGALVLLWNLPAAPTKPSIQAAEQVLTEHAPKAISATTRSTSAARATCLASGASRSPAPRLSRCGRHGFGTRRRSTARGWWRSSPRWAGSPTFQTRNACRSSTR
jgi:ubiquinone/menaquinone biosynthesis C-methylase UbiE